jgi:hypothetical protein
MIFFFFWNFNQRPTKKEEYPDILELLSNEGRKRPRLEEEKSCEDNSQSPDLKNSKKKKVEIENDDNSQLSDIDEKILGLIERRDALRLEVEGLRTQLKKIKELIPTFNIQGEE